MFELPDDFDAFWQQARDESLAVPLNFKRSRANDFALDGFRVETFRFQAMDRRTLDGWIAYPPDAKGLPGFLWIPPYGRESLLPNAYGTREGMVSLSINLHGYGPFHQEKYEPARGYLSEGADAPETYIFRRILQDCMIAFRVLQAQIEVNESQLGCMGMSQGAGLSLWMGAHCPGVRAVCADMPFFGGVAGNLDRGAYRYPLKELADFIETIPMGREQVAYTLSYYDTIHQASRCQVPTLVSLGEKDPASRPENVRRIFDAVAAPQKRLVEYPGGHDWDSQMVDNNRTWLLEHLER